MTRDRHGDGSSGGFSAVLPGKIVLGCGRLAEVGVLARGLGRRALLVRGRSSLEASGRLATILGHLDAAGVEVLAQLPIEGEPLVEQVDEAARRARSVGAAAGDLVLAVGGGSALDLGKAVAALATNRAESVVDYLEGIGRGLSLEAPPLPVMAVPTTAGTGSEATKNAVISCRQPLAKKSLRSEALVPRVALVDPQLSAELPAQITAQTGMDAVCQLIESYLSRRRTHFTSAVSLAGLDGATEALAACCSARPPLAAREVMARAALYSGMALANSGLGMAHGVAAALGIHLQVPHGLACAVLLPIAMRVNRSIAESRLAEIAAVIAPGTYRSEADAADAAIGAIEVLCSAIGIPRRLSELGVSTGDLPQLVRDSRGNSMNGNPRDISDSELAAVLEAHL